MYNVKSNKLNIYFFLFLKSIALAAVIIKLLLRIAVIFYIYWDFGALVILHYTTISKSKRSRKRVLSKTRNKKKCIFSEQNDSFLWTSLGSLNSLLNGEYCAVLRYVRQLLWAVNHKHHERTSRMRSFQSGTNSTIEGFAETNMRRCTT